MATKCKGDDPAFPFVVSSDHVGWHGGLTKRELFALQIAAGLAADPESTAIAPLAVQLANELIAELNRKAGE